MGKGVVFYDKAFHRFLFFTVIKCFSVIKLSCYSVIIFISGQYESYVCATNTKNTYLTSIVCIDIVSLIYVSALNCIVIIK